MLKEKTISKVGGLHASDCAVFVQHAQKFKSDVHLIKGNKKVNAKSLMGVLSLTIKDNDVVYLSTEGIDEKEASIRLFDFL